MDISESKTRWASQRRVPRASQACETCRARKTKCDQAQPCSYCAYHSFDCVFRTPGDGGTPNISSKRKRDTTEPQQSQSSTIRPSPWPNSHQNQTPPVLNETNKSPVLIGSPKARSSGSSRARPHTGANVVPETTIALTRAPEYSHSSYCRPLDILGAKLSTSPASTSDLGDAASRDGLSGVNLHTNGTEFYGNSSNLAFLGNLYARAQSHGELRDQNRPEDDVARQTQPVSPKASQDNGQKRSGRSQLSIVNLLYNADYNGHPSPQSHDGADIAAQRSPSAADGARNRPSPKNNADHQNGLEISFPRLTESAQMEIEKIFIGSYFANKHYIHPLLCKNGFMQRCENEAWPPAKRPSLFRGSTKFAGLYFAVVALGAINASPNETSLLSHFCQQYPDASHTTLQDEPKFRALDFARFFFSLARQTLGDLFETSCLETAQALVLLSVFRQNSLQPHSCYMYSGMAARTAAAIGLSSSMSSLPPNARREARRTWWCIYSHEIEMCCSSGRLDSMKDLHYYQASLPKLKINAGDLDPDAEENDIAMIPVMVFLARIMSEASHQLYHSTQRSMNDKSCLAMALDQRLLGWKARIPSFLNLDAHALNDPEWAFKQKLVLRLRYYNTRILIHKPFLVAATANPDSESPDLSIHLHTCLAAARASINMQYESFMHRIYIRTWWYNTTYALYGSMILLHLVLSNYPGLPDDELLGDVEKSLEIFSSMDDIIVARRCAEMLREVLEVARTCLARRRRHDQNQTQGPSLSAYSSNEISALTHTSTDLAAQSHPTPDSMQIGADRSSLSRPAPNLPMSTPGISLDTPSSILGQSDDTDDGDFFFSFFSDEAQVQPDRTRAEMLANLVDPSILEDFAFGGGNGASFF